MSWNIELPDANYYELGDRRLETVINEVLDQDVVAIDTETTGLKVWKDMPLFWSLAWGEKDRICMPASTLGIFKDCFADSTKRWVFANAKFDMHMLANAGVDIAGDCVDTAVMHALLYEEDSHSLKDMAKQILGWRWSDFFDTFKPLMVPDGTKTPKMLKSGAMNTPMRRETIQEMLMRCHRDNRALLVDYASNDAYGTLRLYDKLKKELEKTNIYSLYPEWLPTMAHLFFCTEVPFTKVLYDCEREGIYVDRPYLQNLRVPMWDEHEKLRRDMVRLSGDPNFNPNSVDQLRDYFLNHEGLKPLMMTKGGKSGIKQASIDKGFLEHYEHESEMAACVLRDRKLTKLIGTYIDGADEHLDPNSRIHTRFNQDVARTGRLSCVAAWTPIKTPAGNVHIDALKVGDQVWTHRGRWRRVLDVFTKGFEDMFDVHFCNGEVLTCTTAHRLLQQDGGWETVGELIEHLESMGSLHAESAAGTTALPLNGAAHPRSDCRTAGNHVPQRGSCGEAVHATSGTARAGGSALLSVEERQQEPHEREDRRAAPQLQGGVPRWQGLPDLPLQRQTTVCASRSHGKSTAFGRAALLRRGAPYRQRPDEQRAGQLGADHSPRAPEHSLFAGEGLAGRVIEKVVYRGRLEVHDLTVEEDASYEACGVFSHNSSDPNLQNIPTPEKDKFQLRGAFRPQPGTGNTLIVGDYAALEMRLLACATATADNPAGAKEMIQIFLDGKDIHMGNAELVFGPIIKREQGWDLTYDFLKESKKLDGRVKAGELPHSALTARHELALVKRNHIKTISFGMNYGMKENKLARSLGISKQEALDIIDAYLHTHPAIEGFYADAIKETQETGFSFTLLGRRRFHPAIHSNNKMDRWSEERKCVNNQIQGTAADAVRLAMLRLSKANLFYKYGCKMLLQIHDELMFECPEETAQQAKAEIQDIMQHPFPTDLLVPLDVSIGTGPAWNKAK